MRLLSVAAMLLLAGCVDRTHLPADEGQDLDPVVFFAGRSQGIATLDKLVGDDVAVRVASTGRSDGRGGLILDQRIREGDKKTRQRRWIMRPAGLGRYSGSLTDAVGPVDIRVDGPRAFIAYTMKNRMRVDQQLALQADGRTIRNRLTVSRFGIRLATLDEIIRKAD